VHPSSIRTFHMPDLSPMLDRLCVRRLYECYVDRLVQHLLLSVDWVVAARSVEETAGSRRPAACMLLQAYAHARASPSRDSVLLTVILRLLSWQVGRV
jgi:hypothetical protein